MDNTKKINLNPNKDDILNGLRRDFPQEAFYKFKKDGKDFTGLYVQFLIDRLNDVCGTGEWQFEHEMISRPSPTDNYEVEMDAKGKIKRQSGDWMPYAIIKGRLHIPYWAGNDGTKKEWIVTPFQFGGNANDDDGDALKGAVTDCMIKCSQYLGVAKKMYLEDPIENTRGVASRATNKILDKIKKQND